MSFVQWLRNVFEGLRTSFWFVPSLMATAAVVLALSLGWVDESVGPEYLSHVGWVYGGGAEGARSVLSAIASSVIGVAGTTFSITIAVLSLASGQFGPRLLRTFMRDLGNQVVLGTFTSTFLYCLLVLRTIRGTNDDRYVPHVSVTVGVGLAVLSVGVLIYFVNHVAESIQVSHLVKMVGADADAVVARLCPEHAGVKVLVPPFPDEPPFELFTEGTGYVDTVDEESLLGTATEHDLLVRLEIRPGDYVVPRTRLLSAWPASRAEGRLTPRFMACARDRTTQQDLEFAFLQLAEIAVRALSPSTNDPFTAMMCVDRITASMCKLGDRSWPASTRADDAGRARLVARRLLPAELVDAAFGHIRHAAERSPIVTRKLRHNLRLLLERVHEPELHQALERELAALGPDE